jgi:hypothetical protein
LRTLSLVVASAIIVSTGVVHGIWTQRWGRSHTLETRVAKLKDIPRRIDVWEGRDSDLDRRSIEQAGIAGYLLRHYENRRDGSAVNVLLVCGPPGPIAVHTPEVCYGGIGYEPSAPRVKSHLKDVGRRDDEVWALDLEKPGLTGQERLHILYAWSADGTWRASEAPRVDFAGSPALCKIYVIRKATEAGATGQDDACARFLQVFLPELRKSLFPTS